MRKMCDENARSQPSRAHIENSRKRLRRLHTEEGADTWWETLVQILLKKVADWGEENLQENRSVAERARELLTVLFMIRSKCRGDEGIALHTADGENVASIAMQPLGILSPVRLWNDKPLARRKSILEQAGGLRGLLEQGLGTSFELNKAASHRKGGIKAAREMLCNAGLCYKVYDDSSEPAGAEEAGLRYMAWCPDEIYHNFPRRSTGRVRCQVRLSPTTELLRIARETS